MCTKGAREYIYIYILKNCIVLFQFDTESIIRNILFVKRLNILIEKLEISQSAFCFTSDNHMSWCMFHFP
jgi:hypothetical protein